MQKSRLNYIDVARGILILMVVYGHIYWVFCKTLLIKNIALEYYGNFQDLWIVFYMPAFFMLTGYVSNFNKSFLPFLQNQLKTLILPAISLFVLSQVLTYLFYDGNFSLGIIGAIKGQGFWFLYALFVAKILYYFLCKIRILKVRILFTLVIYLSGIFLNNANILEFWSYQHAFLLLPSLVFGNLMRKIEKWNYLAAISASIYIFLLLIYIFVHYKIPRVTGGIFLPMNACLPYLLLSTCGIIFFFHCSKTINKSSILEYLGRNSLVIYCLHVAIIKIVGNYLITYIPHFGYILMALCYIFTLFFSIGISVIFAEILNRTKLRVIIGKF